MLDLEKLAHTPLERDPFEYVIINNFIEKQALDAARAAYPDVPGAGSHPSVGLTIEGGFRALIDELLGDAFEQCVAEKFDIDLSNRPTMYTIRGFCREKDGQIHTDSKTKIITVLLYMNDDSWQTDKGRLRILRSPHLEDYAAEVNPRGGTLLMFKRSDISWHGHHKFVGPRRAIQLNWVTDASVVRHEQGRHGISSRLKKLFTRG